MRRRRRRDAHIVLLSFPVFALSAGEDHTIVDRSTIPYCNLPNKNVIPPIATEAVDANPGLKLLQVQAVARHGSRTPYTKYRCWNGWENFKWDCNVTDMGIPDTRRDGDGRPAAWLFRKVYDASPTYLGGTCHVGQLIRDGYLQENDNGVTLKGAYIGEGDLKLFSTSDISKLKDGEVYLRSDDDPSYRTEMSGEFLVRGMFETSQKENLPWHTGDFGLDDIFPNGNTCPGLRALERAAFASPEWALYNNSAWAAQLNKDMRAALPGYQWHDMLDCLMTTTCTERPFPVTLTREVFDKALEYSTEFEAFVFHWNDSYYSRLSMGPFAATLLENMEAAASGDTNAFKFGLFLGHDTTLLPLLLAWDVWDKKWPSYASLLSIELYKSDHQDLFRMVYGGKELIVPGCASALCPFGNLVKQTRRWAQRGESRPCDPQLYELEETTRSPVVAKLASAAGISVEAGAMSLAMVLSMLVGILMGSIATIAWSRRGLDRGLCANGYERSLPLQEFDSL